MSSKWKITIIFWWVISFLSLWVWLLIYFISAWKDGVASNITADILQWWETTTWDVQVIDTEIITDKIEINVEKEEHNISIYTYKGLLDSKRFNYLSRKYERDTSGNIEYIYENDLNKYYEKIKFLLSEKDDSFDIAIVPSEWYQWFEWYNQIYQLQIEGVSLTSIFHYSFQNYLAKNKLRAVPFAIDPIVSFISNREIEERSMSLDWLKEFILKADRFNSQWTRTKIPTIIGIDNRAAELLRKKDYYFEDIMYEVISIYYRQALEKKDRQIIKTLMSFGEDRVYKTWDSVLFKRLTSKYKDWFCANYKSYCLLFDRKTYLVPGFISDLYNIEAYLENNNTTVFKRDYMSVVNLPLEKDLDYPVRGWIMIVNPNGKNKDFVMDFFFKWFVTTGQEWKLDNLYTVLYSPFVSNGLNNKKFPILNNYLNNILLLEDVWINQKRKLDTKLKDALLWDYGLNLLVEDN